MAGARTSRDEWRKRVERWKDSGLSAQQFAAEMGVNAGALQQWSYKLKSGTRPPARRQRERHPPLEAIVAPLVEVRPEAAAASNPRCEVEFKNGRRVRVPPEFAPDELRALLAIVEAA